MSFLEDRYVQKKKKKRLFSTITITTTTSLSLINSLSPSHFLPPLNQEIKVSITKSENSS